MDQPVHTIHRIAGSVFVLAKKKPLWTRAGNSILLQPPQSASFPGGHSGVRPMSRPWRLVVVFLAVAGCKGPGSASTATDPFFGRTRVEPPRTGAVRGQLPSTSNLAQGLNTGVGAPGMVQGQTAAGTGAGSSLPSNGSGASSSQPTQGSGSNSTGWFPAQPRTTSPVPAAIPPQTSGQYVPPDGSFGFPGPSPTSNLATSSPPGESISIPLAARTMGSPASDWSTRPVATPPSGTTSPSTASAGDRKSVV